MYYIYMLGCTDKSIYTGITMDISRRIKEHYYKLPGCAKYTKSHSVCSLLALWRCEDKAQASSLEWHIKQLSKSKKLKLIDNPRSLQSILGDKFSCEIYTPDDSISFELCVNIDINT